jgi:ribosomal-protein-alanine N-acetyltransferase
MNATQLATIRTPRSVLTLLRPENAQLLSDYKLRNAAHLGPWEPARSPAHESLALASHSAAQRAWQAYLDGTAVHFIAIDPNSGRMLAACNFSNVVRGAFQACNLGYSVDAEFQGQGLMFEIVQAGIAHMFEQHGLHRIMANHMPGNTRSAALLNRLGFEREGYARAYLLIAGQWQDMVLNALLNPSP